MTVTSMTGFAVVQGQADGLDWQWEARSVNHRGLDLRIRLPEGFEAIEAQVRSAAQAKLARGSVQVGLRLTLGDTGGETVVNTQAVTSVMRAAAEVVRVAGDAGVDLAPISLGDIFGQRGVLETARAVDRGAAHVEKIATDLPVLFTSLMQARAKEGRALHGILTEQLDAIEGLVTAAAQAAPARGARQAETLKARVQALLASEVAADAARLEQELALLAVKTDVTEELDRLVAHVAAARELLASDKPVGRRLDFLTQEFNREANTLCSKSQDTALTAIGLELKVVIDQMREQSANVE
ncbi:MAG: YicC/YloC family endoribonuclease [Pseudomonadota bacterium]